METTLSNAVMPLIEAAYEGNTVQVQSLLDEGANVNEKDASGRTALMIAANRGHTYVVQLLLERGANPLARDHQGKTAMEAAESRGFNRIVSMLRKFSEDAGQTVNDSKSNNSRERHSLHKAVDEGDFSAVKSLIASGSDVNERTADGWTPLMLATIKGQTQMVESLLKNGADSNARNKKGWAALMFAASMSDVETMRILLAGGANINARDKDGKTALIQAANENNLESVKALLEANADCDMEDHACETALDIAHRRGYTEVVELLRERGAQTGSAAKASLDAKLSSANTNEVIKEGELDRLKKELDVLLPDVWPGSKALVPQHVGVEGRGSVESQALVPMQMLELGERLIATLHALRQAKPVRAQVSLTDIAQKLVLTLAEAAALSSLSRNHLREAISDGRLKAKVIGRGWRIKRADLDLYVRAL